MSRTHLMTDTPEYRSWAAMKRRCDNKNTKDYQRYGARGISYHPSWKSFEAFYADMGNRPDGKTLDRIDHNKDYTPDNCRWATEAEQQRNKSTNVWIEFDGIRETLSWWANNLNMPVETLRHRLANTDDLQYAFYGDWQANIGKSGSSNNNAKLDEWSVAWIKRLMNAGNKQKYVAEIFGVHRDTIRNIMNGRIWSHVEV